MNNIFEDLPNHLTEEVFETLVDSATVRIERIVSKGHTSPNDGWYDQDQNEWVIVLKGEAILSFEESAEVRLTKGSYINIPAHQKHRVDWTSRQSETIWLAVFY